MWTVPVSHRENLTTSDLQLYIQAILEYFSSVPSPGPENQFRRSGRARALVANSETFLG